MRKNFTYVCSVYLFLIKDNSILLLRRVNTGYADGYYALPAGHLEGQETAREGCVREVKEEIGVDLEIEDLELVHTMHRKSIKDERVDFFFTTVKYSGEVSNGEPNKCDDLRWFSLDDLPENIIDFTGAAIESYKKGIRYSEFGWDK